MCRKVVCAWLIIAFLLCDTANAQQYAFQVTFTDKKNTPYSLSSPLAYLSARAMARRTRQGIAVDSTDIPVNTVYVDSILSLTGGIFHCTSRWLNMCIVLLSDSSQIEHLTGKSFIHDVQLVGYYATDLHHRDAAPTSSPTPLPTPASRTGSVESDYYNNSWIQALMVNGNYLHDKGYMGQGMLIAVLDAGFISANTHPGFDSLWSSGRVLDTFNFTFHSTGVFTQDSHGAQVLSTMAGYIPNSYVGTAPLASYALYVTEKNGNDQPLEMDNMISGAERADSLGADVITESLGYDIFDYPPGSGLDFATQGNGITTVATKAANISTKKGMLFVATAGNDGGGYLTWGDHISVPGDADSALTIGSVYTTGLPAASSGFGPNAAGRVKPDVCALGQPAEVFDISSNGYIPSDGTSFSTPQIAGWAACLWQSTPTATPYILRQVIIKCASTYSSPQTQLGYGIPDFECTEQALNVRDTPPPVSSTNWLVAAPNPFNTDLRISVDPDVDGEVTFTLIDVAGRQVTTNTQYLYQGYNTPVIIPSADIPAGIYILKANSATQQKVVKLEKL